MSTGLDFTLEHIDAALAERAEAKRLASEELKKVWDTLCVDDCW